MKGLKRFSLLLVTVLILTALFSSFVVADGINGKSNSEKIILLSTDFNHPLRDTDFEMMRNGEIKISTSEDGRTSNVEAVNVNDLIRQGKLKTVQVVAFNDFHGCLAEDVGQTGKNVGMAKLVTAVKDAVAANPNTIVVSGGDNYQGTAMSNLTYGLPVSKMMKSMGVAASAVGNHEFDWGVDRIKTWAKDGNFSFLAANIYNRQTKKPVDWAKPYLMITKGGVKVAFIGLAHPDTSSLTKAEYTAGLEFRDPVAAAQQWINFLKAGNAREGKPDVIFALSHLDSAQNPQTGEITGNAAELCKKVQGLDGVISAHSHRTVSGTVNKIPVVQAYYNGRTLATLAIVLDPKGKVKTVLPAVNPIYTNKSNIIPDRDSAKDYAQFEQKLKPILGEKIGMAIGDFAHDRSVKDTVTPLGKWVCDVMRQETGAQIAIQNGGGLRRSLKAGEITVGDLYEIMPFDNYLVTLELPGSELKKAIDHGIDNPSITDGQFSGLKVTYNPKAEFEKRVVSISLENGAPVRDDQYYTVVINDFMLTGGDKYDFSKARKVKNTYLPVRDVLIEAIKKAKTLSPPQIDYIKPLTMNVRYLYKLAV
jgi:2',3'-cyclic-nucleotide 2'-phosphodiesterase (5'-nucleotidase family)